MDQPAQPSRPTATPPPANPPSREALVQDIAAKQKRGEFTPFAGPRLGGENDTLGRRSLLGGGRSY